VKKLWTYTKAVIFTSGIVLPFYVGYDVLFSRPRHLEGIIVEKIFVPARAATGATPYGGVRRSNYFITVQRQDQWIAIVRTEPGDPLTVHCLSSHYDKEHVGDTIHFKKYQGEHLHIRYFGHNEEED